MAERSAPDNQLQLGAGQSNQLRNPVIRMARCPRCLEFEEEIRVLQQQLAASGQYVTYSPGPNSNPNVNEELRRWQAASPNADAAAGYRAGWTRLARFVGPKLRDWESRWLRAKRDGEGLKAHINVLVAECERLRDSR